jgi:hypothetical protein
MHMSNIKENSFEGGPGGSNGTSNYQTGYGTPASPATSQNSAQFTTTNANKAVNQQGQSNNRACSPDSTVRDRINALFAKPNPPTPDEFKAGIDYELGQMIKKDTSMAIEAVLNNLEKDPKYYSGLKMLNIDDKSMVNNMGPSDHESTKGDMSENKHPNDKPLIPKVTAKVDETKKIFAEMAVAKDNKFVVNSHLVDVMKEMWEAKRKRRM